MKRPQKRAGRKTATKKRTAAKKKSSAAMDAPKTCNIHMLDVGLEKYGDSVLCQFGDLTVLFDGAHQQNSEKEGNHPSIPEQLGKLLGQNEPPYTIDLIVVTHQHDDHIGCLPVLVQDEVIRANWALVADPYFRWGESEEDAKFDSMFDARTLAVVEALQEEPRGEMDDASLRDFIDRVKVLKERYRDMLEKLEADGTRVVRYGRGTSSDKEEKALLKAFQSAGMKILGPRKSDLPICRKHIAEIKGDRLDALDKFFTEDFEADPVALYRQLITSEMDGMDRFVSDGPYINYQSFVIHFEFNGKKFLFTGDRQLADTETGDPVLEAGNKKLLQLIKENGPYDYMKLAHHGSTNGLSESILNNLKSQGVVGLCTGENSAKHPHPVTLKLLKAYQNELKWVRTDRNGQTTLNFKGQPVIKLTKGKVNDAANPKLWKSDQDFTDLKSVPMDASVAEAQPKGDRDFSFMVPEKSKRITITIDLE